MYILNNAKAIKKLQSKNSKALTVKTIINKWDL